MIDIKNLNFAYSNNGKAHGLKNINIHIKRGELVVICGSSGGGKTTFTRIINGLIPDYYLGDLSGNIIINDKSMSGLSIYQYVGLVGSVFQNPRSQFYNVAVIDELAFGAENMGIEKEEIINRISSSSEKFEIESFLNRSLFDLSGGEKQKIACASIDVMHPEIIVLDEPTSNLDFKGINQLKRVLKFWKEQGKTIIISEHRLYWLSDIADRYVHFENGEIKNLYSKETFLNMDISERHNMGLRSSDPFNSFDKEIQNINIDSVKSDFLEIKNLKASYKKNLVLNIENISIKKGDIVGILGSNGAGKSTFSKCLCGLNKQSKGEIIIDGIAYKPKDLVGKSYMVMQDVNHQLFTESVLEEVILSMDYDLDEKEKKERAIAILKDLNLFDKMDLHPHSLSGGEKQRVAIASAIASSREIIIFDEPTSGLDYLNMREVANQIMKLKANNKTVLIISHDPELINLCCEKLLFMEKGTIKWIKKFSKSLWADIIELIK